MESSVWQALDRKAIEVAASEYHDVYCKLPADEATQVADLKLR